MLVTMHMIYFSCLLCRIKNNIQLVCQALLVGGKLLEDAIWSRIYPKFYNYVIELRQNSSFNHD